MHFSRFFSLRVACLAAALLIGPLGCAQPTAKRTAIRGGGPTVNADSSYAYHYPSTAPVLNADELKRFVAQHRDRVVVVQFWASWSSRGRSQIAELARLHDQHRADGLRVIACTFDEPREWRTRTIPVLHAEGANFPCVVIPRGDRQAVASWLEPAWSGDLPAQFVINRNGDTVARSRGSEMILAALGGRRDTAPRRSSPRTVDEPQIAAASPVRTATARTTAPAPRPVKVARRAPAATSTDRVTTPSTRTTRAPSPRPRAASPVRTASTVSVGPASTRVRLINLRTGESEWLPVVSRESGMNAAVDALVGRIRGRITTTPAPRFAVLPLTSMHSRDYSTRLGRETAEALVAGLRREGFENVMEPARAESVIAREGLTQSTIDRDPTCVQGVIEADYLLLGWVRNDVDAYLGTRRTVIAGDAGGDIGYASPRQEAEDFSDY